MSKAEKRSPERIAKLRHLAKKARKDLSSIQSELVVYRESAKSHLKKIKTAVKATVGSGAT